MDIIRTAMDIENVRALVGYITLPAIGFFLYHAVLGAYYRFNYKMNSSIWYLGMALFSATYALGVYLQAHPAVGPEYHIEVSKLFWFSGFAGFYCYLNMIKEFSQEKWPSFEKILKILGIMYLVVIVLLMLDLGFVDGKPEPYLKFHEVFHITTHQSNIGKAIGLFSVVTSFGMNFLVFKRLVSQKKKEVALLAGVILTIICSVHDAALGLSDSKYAIIIGVPIFYFGNVLEVIRFSMHYQNRLYSKVRNLKKENERMQNEGEFSRKILRLLSHDITGSLMVLEWVYESIKDKVSGTKEEEIISPELNKLKKSYESMGEMAQTVRKVELTRAGTLKIELGSVSLYDAVEKSVSNLAERAESKSIKIDLTNLSKSVKVTAEKASLTNQVVSNLLTNAIKFSPKNSVIEIYSKENRSEIIFSINDHGVGMSELVKKTLFTNLTAPSSKGTEGEVGTGFGLAICREFVEAYGAALSYESKAGEGTKFDIMFKKA